MLTKEKLFHRSLLVLINLCINIHPCILWLKPRKHELWGFVIHCACLCTNMCTSQTYHKHTVPAAQRLPVKFANPVHYQYILILIKALWCTLKISVIFLKVNEEIFALYTSLWVSYYNISKYCCQHNTWFQYHNSIYTLITNNFDETTIHHGRKQETLTSIPCSLHSSSAFKAEQLTVWKASSQAAVSRWAVLEKRRSSLVSSWMVLMSMG